MFALIITLWIGFGQPKPPPPYKPRSIEGCQISNITDLSYDIVGIDGKDKCIQKLLQNYDTNENNSTFIENEKNEEYV